MSLQQTFIANLRYFRKQRILTQKDLSVYLNKGFNYINCIEGGNSFPPPEVVDQIASILGIDPGQLFQKDGCPENLRRFGKEQYVQEVTDRLVSRLSAVIAKEVRGSLE